jgi:hypothetical protein
VFLLREFIYAIWLAFCITRLREKNTIIAAPAKEENSPSPRRVITARRILDSILRTPLLHAHTARKEIHFYTPGGHTFQNQERLARALQLMLTQQKQLLSLLCFLVDVNKHCTRISLKSQNSF